MEHAFSESNPELSRRDFSIILAVVLLGVGAYLLASALTYRLGFPLDDSWIHQTYARNLAMEGRWEFRLGQLSSGSTAPLWTLLLVPGFWLHLGPLWWSYILGGGALLGLSVIAEVTARRLVQSYKPKLPWVGLFFACEWHMLWAAASGMETALQALSATAVLVLLMTRSHRYLTLGLLTGLSIWVRPDGLTLAGPVVLTIVFVEPTCRDKRRAVLAYLIALGALFLPYLLMNLWLSGTPWPNTFYAKQTEYAAWQAQPILDRAGVLLIQMLTGPSVVLLPGAIGTALLSIRRRDRPMIAAMLWCAGYILLYTLRLPAYQHGRYLMPAMPIFFLFGMLGYLRFVGSSLLGPYQGLVDKAWRLSLVSVTLGFVILGALAYANDVGLIESEMVNTAKWVDTNVPPNAIVAAHDIGALGYFDDHPLIDLAGLVSPQVVPFMRDQARLAQFLNDRGANYLVAFPNLYPELAQHALPVYSSGGRFAPAMGEPNLTVYCWSCR